MEAGIQPLTAGMLSSTEAMVDTALRRCCFVSGGVGFFWLIVTADRSCEGSEDYRFW